MIGVATWDPAGAVDVDPSGQAPEGPAPAARIVALPQFAHGGGISGGTISTGRWSASGARSPDIFNAPSEGPEHVTEGQRRRWPYDTDSFFHRP